MKKIYALIVLLAGLSGAWTALGVSQQMWRTQWAYMPGATSYVTTDKAMIDPYPSVTLLSSGAYSTCTLTATNMPAGYKAVEWYSGVNQLGKDLTKFAGESADNSAVISYDSSKPTSAHYVAVRFGYIDYTLRFDGNGGSVINADVGGHGYTNEWTLVTSAERKGYAFDGWKTGDMTLQPGETITGARLVLGNHDTNVTLVAQWKINQVKVTFKYRNGSGGIVSAEQSVEYGGEATPPDSATVNGWVGHTFVKWDSKNFDNITKDTEFMAEYAVNYYGIRFDANGGKGTMQDIGSISYEDSVALPKNRFVRDGYEFLGWDIDPDSKTAFYTDQQTQIPALSAINGDVVTLYAIWSPIKYAIAFAANGGEGEMTALNATYDQPVTLTKCAFTKAGCDFQHWLCGGVEYADGAVVSNLTMAADATVTMTAVWNEPYWVKFEANGGEGEMEVQRFELGEAAPLTANAFSKTGYTFAGWATNALTEVKFADGEVVMDIGEVGETNSLFAVWSNNTYRVKFEANGGEGEMAAQSFTYDRAQALSANAFTRDGFWAFGGWAREPDAETAVFADGEEVKNLTAVADGEVTLYAVWNTTLSKLSLAMGCNNLIWTNGTLGMEARVNPWQPGEAGACQTGGNLAGQMVLQAAVSTNGTLSFRWRPTGELTKLVISTDESADAFAKSVQLSGTAGEWNEYSVEITNAGGSALAGESPTKYFHLLVWDMDESAQIDITNMTWKVTCAHPEPTEEDSPDIATAKASGDRFELTFTSDENFAYQLESTDSLVAPVVWQTVGVPKVGTGERLAFEPAIEDGVERRFYRVKVLQRKD